MSLLYELKQRNAVRHAATAALLLLAGTVALSGCAQTVRVKSDWQPDAARDQPFSRVLVVGVSPDYNQRCAFEGFVANQIRSEATAAFTSCHLLSHDEPLTRENIDRVIVEHDVDAVLATILVAAEVAAQEGGTSETRGEGYYKATDYGYAVDYYGRYGAYGVPVVYGEFRTAPPITTVRGSVDIASRLYETGGATLVYEVTTTAHDLESRAGGLAEVSGAIADRLRRDGLIR